MGISFLHYELDPWTARTYPAIQFERYADDVALFTLRASLKRSSLARSGPAMSEGMLFRASP